MSKNDDIIWNRKTPEELIEDFRIIYPRWAAAHPERVKNRPGTKIPRTVDDYIEHFRNHISAIVAEAEKEGYPWMWAIDDLTRDGRFFNPWLVILGNARFFTTSGDGNDLQEIMPFKSPDPDAINKRYRIENPYWKSSSNSINVEAWICNYFRKPIAEEIWEGGHIVAYDPEKSCTENNNMYNVFRQSDSDNKRSAAIMRGNGLGVLKRDDKRIMKKQGIVPARGFKVETDLPLNILSEIPDDKKGVEFHRDKETGRINKITLTLKPLNTPPEEARKKWSNYDEFHEKYALNWDNKKSES